MVNAIGDIEIRTVADHSLVHALSSHIDRVTGVVWSGSRVFACDERGRVMRGTWANASRVRALPPYFSNRLIVNPCTTMEKTTTI